MNSSYIQSGPDHINDLRYYKNRWKDDNFISFLKNNFKKIILNLAASYKARSDFFQSTNSCVLPCRRLYDYLIDVYASYQTYKKDEYLNTFLLNTSNGFTVAQWNGSFAKLRDSWNNTESQSLTNDSTPISSQFNDSNPWANEDFFNYVQNNIQILVKDITIALSYVVPSASLFDYFFSSYQHSITQNALSTLPPTLPFCINPVSCIFHFKNIILSGEDGMVFLHVNVENLPGYWDTYFKLPIIKASSTLHADLNMPSGNASIGGNLTVHDTSNLKGNLTVHDTSNLKGNVALDSNINVNGNLTVHDTSNLKGNVTLDSDINVNGISTLVGQTHATNLSVSDKTTLNGAVQVKNELSVTNGFLNNNFNSALHSRVPNAGSGGLSVGWNRSGGNAEVNFYNTFNNDPTTAFQFASYHSVKKQFDTLATITGKGRIKDKTGDVTPVGGIMAFGGAIAPTGWLFCDGSTISSQYTDLIEIVGANTPDLRSRFVVGANPDNSPINPDLTSCNLKDTGGEEKHKLNEAEMPKHNHQQYYPNQMDHHQGYPKKGFKAVYASDRNAATGGSAAMIKTGGNQSHNNLPPYYALIYIIKC